MKKRQYQHVQLLLPKVQEMISEGMTQREIAEQLGFESKITVKNLLYRSRKQQIPQIPKQRGRKPAKTLQEYKYENQRLKMENDLLRDFLQSMERK